MKTIEDYIEQNAVACPDKVAIVCGEERCTYRSLQKRISTRVTEFRGANRQKGQIVCLRALPTIDFLVDYWALHLTGCVATPLEKDMTEAAFQKISTELSAQVVAEGSADIINVGASKWLPRRWKMPHCRCQISSEF